MAKNKGKVGRRNKKLENNKAEGIESLPESQNGGSMDTEMTGMNSNPQQGAAVNGATEQGDSVDNAEAQVVLSEPNGEDSELNHESKEVDRNVAVQGSSDGEKEVIQQNGEIVNSKNDWPMESKAEERINSTSQDEPIKDDGTVKNDALDENKSPLESSSQDQPIKEDMVKNNDASDENKPPLQDINSEKPQGLPKKRLTLQERLALAAAKGSKKPSRSVTPVVIEKEESPVALETNELKEEGPSTYEKMSKEELIEALWKKALDNKTIGKAHDKLAGQNRLLTEKLETKTSGDKNTQGKDQIIKELLEEGAKLSAKEVNLTQTIKKMRQRERDLDEQVTRLTDNETSLKESLESLQTRSKMFEKAEKSLSEKDSFIEKLGGQLESATLQKEEVVSELKIAQKSVQRLQRAEEELKDKTGTIGRLETQLEKAGIQITLLKQQGKQANNEYDIKLKTERQKAEKMKLEFLDEIQRLETKLETLRTHNEGMDQEESDTLALSKALRSNEFLQTQYTQAQENWQFIETSYLGKISSLENDASILRQKEMEFNKRIRSLQADVQAKSEENEDLYQSQQKLNKRLRELEDKLSVTLKELQVQNEKLEEMEMVHRSELEKLRNAENDFSSSSYFDYEPPRRDSVLSEIGLGESSTTPAIGNSGFFDHSEDCLTMRAGSQTGTNIQVAQRLSSTIQRLEMEIMALRDEVEALETEKAERNSEMLQMMKDSDELKEYKQKVSDLQDQIAETTSQYEACLELLGEKSERVQELQADVQDLKDICRQQVEQLVSMS